MHEPRHWRVVRVRNKRHGDAVGNGDGRILVNAIRVVGHVDDGVRRGIERAITAIAPAVDLRQSRVQAAKYERQTTDGVRKELFRGVWKRGLHK